MLSYLFTFALSVKERRAKAVAVTCFIKKKKKKEHVGIYKRPVVTQFQLLPEFTIST
jgi:hypothetical protein